MANNDFDIVENWDHEIEIHEESNHAKLLEVVGKENKRLDLDIERVYDSKFIRTATGTELEKIGSFVGIKRKNGEGDDKLQKRIEAEFVAQASDTTYSSFASAVLFILEAEANTTNIITPPQAPRKSVTVEVDGSIIADNPLTKTELANLLDKCVSAGGKVNLIETGTFAFAGDDPTLEGWDEGTWSVIVEN